MIMTKDDEGAEEGRGGTRKQRTKIERFSTDGEWICCMHGYDTGVWDEDNKIKAAHNFLPSNKN